MAHLASRHILWSASAAVLAMVLLVAGARWCMPQEITGPVAEGGWTRRTRAAFTVAGVYGAEGDPATGLYRSWTSPGARFRFAQLPSTRAHRMWLRVRSGQSAEAPPPTVTITVNRVVVTSAIVTNDPQTIGFTVPAGSNRNVVMVDTVPSFRPGTSDPRELGVIVEEVGIAPVSGHFAPSLPVLAQTGAAVMALVLGVLLCGASGGIAVAASTVIVIAILWLLLQDAAFLGGYADSLWRISLGALVISSGVAGLRGRRTDAATGAEWQVAAGLLVGLSALKVALIWHPLAIVGDALFQVHRAQLVHAGEYFFTSVTPRPFFEFPYAIALYIAAQPLWQYFRAEADLIHLLRLLAIAVDAVAGLALYFTVRQQAAGRVTALLCAALWPLARAPMEALSNANLTNLFGQGAFAAGLAGFAWWAGRLQSSRPDTRLALTAAAEVQARRRGVGPSRLLLIIPTALLTVGFLSHFGTITVGLATLAAVVATLVTGGHGTARRAGFWLLVMTVSAASVSWIAYYSHFTSVYRGTYVRLTTGERDDTSKIVASPAVKFARWRSGVGDDYGLPGLPVLIVAGAGLGLAGWRRDRGVSTLVLSSWLLAWATLSLLGIYTPLTLRANLAAAPPFTAFCAYGITPLLRGSRPLRCLAGVLAVVIAWDGLRVAVLCLGMAPRW